MSSSKAISTNVTGLDFKRVKEDLAELDESEVKTILTTEEKRFLLFVERGDVASVKHILKKSLKENKRKPGMFNINCVDPLGRSALAVAIENENMPMIKLLLSEGIAPTDSLLYAINEEYVEGVEILLAHEETIHKEGEPYSWQRLEGIRANYTSDITPLILAAHKDNYEILRQLLDRGAALPIPHDVRCGCDECVISTADDSLRHSLSRINAYRALCSSSLICLSSKDPFVTAFSLTKELANLALMENEFKEEYLALRNKVTNFAKNLIENTRTSYELEVVLNYDPEGLPHEKGQIMHLTKLREAVDSRQKKFVAHANVQQLLGTVWYDGMPGFRRIGPMKQLMQIGKIASMFPIYCMAFLFAPRTNFGKAMTKPFIKFIVHSSSYLFFLTLLVIVSLQVEAVLIELFGTDWMLERLREQQKQERGALPSIVETTIIVYILGFIWGEIRGLWEDGFGEYLKDLWNIIDFITNFFYVNWITLRMTAWYQTKREMVAGINPYKPREMWHPFDPMLISEGMFGAANIFSFLKLVHIFSVHPHLGPLQVALGRMVFDIIKFFFVYTLVLFAFGCGLNQMLWYYADMDKQKCYSLPGGGQNPDEELSCDVWRRFSNLFETSQSLFWASFGMVDLFNFDLTGIKPFTRFWGLLMFGSYNLINVIVLLNLLIAMMSNSYATIVEKCDMEWKFARSKLWMSYFEAGNDLPPPFNLIPSPWKLFRMKKKEGCSIKRQKEELRDIQYQKIMRNLVRRYVTKEQVKSESQNVKEDDINEVKQSISSFKYELLNILRINGMKTGEKHYKEDVSYGKKQQARERRLKKGFNIGMVEGIDIKDLFAQHKKKQTVIDFATIVLKALLKGKKADWNQSILGFKNIDQIGSSDTMFKRQSMRNIRRRSAWNRIQFYLRRGVFIGGNINEKSLSEAKIRMKKELRRPPIGWRKLQRLANKGLVTTERLEGDEIVASIPTSVISINPDVAPDSLSSSSIPNVSCPSSSLTPSHSSTPPHTPIHPSFHTSEENTESKNATIFKEIENEVTVALKEEEKSQPNVALDENDEKNQTKTLHTANSQAAPNMHSSPLRQPKNGWL